MRPLRERLEGLQARGRSSERRTAAEASLRERLARLLGPPTLAGADRRQPEQPRDLAAAVDGRWLTEGLLVREETVTLQGSSCEELCLGAWRRPSAAPPRAAHRTRPEGCLFLDAETSGLAGGSGTVIFLLGVGRIDGAVLRLRQFLLTRFGAEAALLSCARDCLCGVEVVVTFNGSTFDLPLLAARHRLHTMPHELGRLQHLDLIYPVRRAFASVWPDCRLQTAEHRLLGVRRPADIPGWEIPQVWVEWVRLGRVGRMPEVLEHNRTDLLSMVALAGRLTRVYEDPVGWGADVEAIARGLRRDGDEPAALRCLLAAPSLTRTGLLELARLHRRRSDWQRALRIWEPLAACGCTEALAQLAKYHEHVTRDHGRALRYALRLAGLEPGREAHHRRVERLRAKSANETDAAASVS